MLFRRQSQLQSSSSHPSFSSSSFSINPNKNTPISSHSKNDSAPDTTTTTTTTPNTTKIPHYLNPSHVYTHNEHNPLGSNNGNNNSEIQNNQNIGNHENFKNISKSNEINYNNNENSLTAPIVFQCSSCNTILGDSLSFVTSDEELKIIVIKNAVNVKLVSNHSKTSTNGKDIGSSYQDLICSPCNNHVGRVYHSTTEALDSARNMFCFEASRISSYVLGQGSQLSGNAQTPSFSWELIRIKQMLILYNERITSLESSLAQVQKENQQLFAQCENYHLEPSLKRRRS